MWTTRFSAYPEWVAPLPPRPQAGKLIQPMGPWSLDRQELTEEEKVRKREQHKRFRDKIKRDPERNEIRKAQRRNYQQQRRADLARLDRLSIADAIDTGE